MYASAQPARSMSRPAADYSELITRGLEPSEAANVAAILAGIRITPQPWTVREISHLLFFRAMREAGLFGPDDGRR